MLETDSPFMRPDREYLPEVKSLRQGRCEPCVLPAVCNAVAECYGVPNPNPNLTLTLNLTLRLPLTLTLTRCPRAPWRA